MLRKFLFKLIPAVSAAIIVSCSGTDKTPVKVKTGEVLPQWSEGYMDIHFINTGRGESVFYIFPDGTTMLIDAAGSLLKYNAKSMPTASKPSDDVSSSDVIEHYIRHYMPAKDSGRLDYVMVSHYHSDHYGNYNDSLPLHPSGEFRVNGMTDVGSRIPFDKMILRGDPRKRYAPDMTFSALDNLFAFIEWSKKAYGAECEYMVPGLDDEIVLTKEPERYPDFKVMNIAANGNVWTGNGTEFVTEIPSEEELEAAGKEAYPAENILSCVMVMDYGKFNYFTGGDLQHNGKSEYPYKDIESQVAKVVPEVDVMKADHHGTGNTNAESLLRALNPSSVIINVWRDVQPNKATITRMYEVNPDCNIFCNNMAERNVPVLGDLIPKFASLSGHIVVRVVPGGSRYYIYVLDDNDEEYRVTKITGPVESK